jgi:hypothetical protein
MPAPRVADSQMIRIHTPKIAGITSLSSERPKVELGWISASRLTQRQASSHAPATSRKNEGRAAPSLPVMPVRSSHAASCAPMNRMAAAITGGRLVCDRIDETTIKKNTSIDTPGEIGSSVPGAMSGSRNAAIR